VVERFGEIFEDDKVTTKRTGWRLERDMRSEVTVALNTS